jgi:hypothetical protein
VIERGASGVVVVRVPYDEGGISVEDAAELVVKYRPGKVRFADGKDYMEEVVEEARKLI